MSLISQFINKIVDLFLSSALNFANMSNLVMRSRDFSILTALIVLLFIYGVFFGEVHLVMILLSTYLSYTILVFLPLNNSLFNFYGLNFYFRLTVFIFLIILIYFLLNRLYRIFKKKSIEFSLIRMILLSISEVTLFVALVSSFFTTDFEILLSDTMKKYILDDNWKFFLVIFPIIVIGLTTKKKSKSFDNSKDIE